MADPRLRQIFIKSNVLRRIAKEKISYEKEAEKEKGRLQKFKDQDKDEHDLKKQEEVIQENLMMIPECARRVKTAFEELEKMLNEEKDLEEKDEYIKAVAVLEDVRVQLSAC